MFRPRPYQTLAEDEVFRLWDSGITSVLGIASTGLGKTIMFANIIKRMGGRAIVFAGTRELVGQSKDKIKKVTGLSVEIEMGEMKARVDRCLFHPHADVVCSSWQTAVSGGDGNGRMSKFSPDDFRLVIIDEADGAISPSYKKIIKYFSQNPKIKILGVTATIRSDNQALGQIFEKVGFNYGLQFAIGGGWLVPIVPKMAYVEGITLEAVGITAGDFNSTELNEIMIKDKPLYGVVKPIIDEIGSDKQGIGFASSVEHAKKCSDIMNTFRAGMSAHVSGKTPEPERIKIVEDFRNGKIQFLWNYNIYVRGFDVSNVSVVAIARPTKSATIITQCVGRGTRPHESVAHKLDLCPADVVRRAMISRSLKPNCVVLDFCGSYGKHRQLTTAEILGGKISDEVMDNVMKRIKKSGGKAVQMDKEIAEEEKRIAERNKKREEEIAKRAKIKANVSYRLKEIDPFALMHISASPPQAISPSVFAPSTTQQR